MRRLFKCANQRRRQTWLSMPAHQIVDPPDGKDSSGEALGGLPGAQERREGEDGNRNAEAGHAKRCEVATEHGYERARLRPAAGVLARPCAVVSVDAV
jgi:hypothetical protein